MMTLEERLLSHICFGGQVVSVQQLLGLFERVRKRKGGEVSETFKCAATITRLGRHSWRPSSLDKEGEQ